jgi:hypothetical protein
MFGGGGMYGGGGYGGGMGGMFGMPMDPNNDPMPKGMRNVENLMVRTRTAAPTPAPSMTASPQALGSSLPMLPWQYSVGRITQMLEMNFEVLQHFLGSLSALCERLRGMYHDARNLTASVGRQSLEFGQAGVSSARDARSTLRDHPLKALGLLVFALGLLIRRYGWRRRLTARGAAPGAATALGAAFATSDMNLGMNGAWRP